MRVRGEQGGGAPPCPRGRTPPGGVRAVPHRLLYSLLVNAEATPPVGQPLQLVHPVLPDRARLWGAGRPSYPDEPPSAAAVEAGVRLAKSGSVSS